MPAPEIIRQLVERFEQNREAYRSGKYNETQLRREFLDSFFETLGWDVNNRQGYAEAYKDVIHEDSLEVEGATKAPDYAFRIGGMRKFFVEAKKPAVNIQYDIHPAFQLRRYAWSAKLPLSILTDFEEFAVYDCRSKPDKSDSAATGRVMFLTCKDYAGKWDDLAAIFSRQAVLKGSFDKYAETTKGKKGTAEVDDAFLEEIERWRDLLARNIALRNPDLSVRKLNFAVQMTIDRIIFLRICEDRGVERDEQLKEISEGKDVYAGLCQLFRQADARYNSGLFHFSDEKGQSSAPDALTLKLQIDDKVLKDILRNLYYPDSPYVFSEIPADILGQVYERFLGKVIRLTAGHQAKVEEKPEVRKAGGVYYTPTYIVDYIVKNTVGKLLEGDPTPTPPPTPLLKGEGGRKGLTPKDAARLKILDPACGSGSFLLGTYQYLLDWHLRWYGEHEPEKHARGNSPAIYQAQGGEWRLTTAEKKRILLDNIHGVDIDAQAVEVTKLTLLLKVLEGESSETIGSQLALFQERVLPDLGRNIQCGNSLIGPDYYEGHQLTMGFADDEERYRVNAFDWKAEFPAAFIQGGFDVVIGNPPWVFTRDVAFGEEAKDYFARHYVGAKGKVNHYALFIYRGISLLKKQGWFSMIVPNTFLRATTYQPLREKILRDGILQQITDTGENVFEGVTASTVIIAIKVGIISSQVKMTRLENSGIELDISIADQSRLLENPNVIIDLYGDDRSRQITKKIQDTSMPLDSFITHLISGIQTWKLHKSNFISDRQINDEYKPLLEGKDIGRYETRFNHKYIWYSKKVLNVMQDEKIFLLPEKILIQRVSGGERPLRATIDRDGFYCFNSINTLVCTEIDNRYVLGILNSRLMNWLYSLVFSNKSELTVNIAAKNLRQLPIRPINFSDPAEKAKHDKMVTLVERMLALRKQSPRTPQEQEIVKRESESTDGQIDRLVYELYGLTEDEVKVVGG